MPMNQLLRQIRETRRFGVDQVATFTSISPVRLAQFETGEREPSFRQIERLADAYGVPSYVLASKVLPNLEESLPDLRRAEPGPSHLSPAGMRKVWLAENSATFTSQLAVALDYVKPDWSIPQELPSTELATSVRAQFEDWYRRVGSRLALTGTHEQNFFNAFRIFLEAQGTIVNVNDAPPDDFFGFYTKRAARPLTFVNRSISSKKAQLFTLLHEYAHHLVGVNGVSDPFLTRNRVERTCNRFAADFLAPMASFRELAEKQSKAVRDQISNFVNIVSRQSLLSRHATAIRLFEGGYISQTQLNEWTKLNRRAPRAEKEDEREEAGETRGAVHAKRIGELGYLPVYLAKRAVDKKIVDSLDVQRGLGLSEGLQADAFSLASRRMEVALGA